MTIHRYGGAKIAISDPDGTTATIAVGRCLGTLVERFLAGDTFAQPPDPMDAVSTLVDGFVELAALRELALLSHGNPADATRAWLGLGYLAALMYKVGPEFDRNVREACARRGVGIRPTPRRRYVATVTLDPYEIEVTEGLADFIALAGTYREDFLRSRGSADFAAHLEEATTVYRSLRVNWSGCNGDPDSDAAGLSRRLVSQAAARVAALDRLLTGQRDWLGYELGALLAGAEADLSAGRLVREEYEARKSELERILLAAANPGLVSAAGERYLATLRRGLPH
jgi:hypothetical protein